MGRTPLSVRNMVVRLPRVVMRARSRTVERARQEANASLPEELARQIALHLEALRAPKINEQYFARIAERWGRIYVTQQAETAQGDLRSTLTRLIGLFGQMGSDLLTKPWAEACLSALTHARTGKAISARTFNKYRWVGMKVVELGIADKEWGGENPFKGIKRRKLAKKRRAVLSPSQAASLLDCCLEPSRRNFYAWKLYTGCRAGEAYKVRCRDVDLVRKTYSVLGSNARDVTKNGEVREDLPLHDELVPYVRAQLASHRSEWLFPGPDGLQHPPEGGYLSKRLKADLKRAGIVDRWRHYCRKRGCEHSEEHADKGQRHCPEHGRPMATSAIPPDITVRCLRRCSATLMKKAGVDQLARKLMLGHTVKDITDGTYTTVDTPWLRKEILKMSLRRPEEPPEAPPFFDGAPSVTAGGDQPVLGLRIRRLGDRTSPGALSRDYTELGSEVIPGRADLESRPIESLFVALAARFWRRVKKTPQGCWLWTGARTADRYGELKFLGGKVLAHRVSYEISVGPLPPDKVVAHRCDRRLCVRPDHLVAATHEENRADCVAKERHAYGQRNGRSRLTEDQVREIRKLLKQDWRLGELARQYRVDRATIRHIRDGKTWRRVTGGGVQ